MPPAPEDDATRLGAYRVLRPLGDTPVGDVLLGADGFGRSVVLTVVHPALAATAGFRERFGREARAAAAAPPWFVATDLTTPAEPVRSVALACLHKDPRGRPSAAQVAAMLDTDGAATALMPRPTRSSRRQARTVLRCPGRWSGQHRQSLKARRGEAPFSRRPSGVGACSSPRSPWSCSSSSRW